MSTPSAYLEPVPDGLMTRTSQPYALYKLNALRTYLHITNTAMRDKWQTRFYVDLQAGPGKNAIEKEITLGSPLIALTAPHPATHFRLNEWDSENKAALEQRVAASPLVDRVKIYADDLNSVVHTICAQIDHAGPSLNIAFLDPEGLELKWTTIERLAKVERMDLIINFSTQGIFRLKGRGETGDIERLNEFFGSTRWQQINLTTNAAQGRRELIDFYRQQLEKFGYHIEIDPNLGGHDLAVNNSRNAQVYSMIFASKNPLGDKFWKQATKRVKPPKLPGFE
jgi:three-Cys-motif partner protein